MSLARRWRILVFLGLPFIVAAHWILPSLIQSALKGESFEYLNALVRRHHLKDPTTRTPEYYQLLITQLLIRLDLVLILVGGFLLFLATKGRQLVIHYFFRPTHPINLAIFRIVIYALVFQWSLALTLFEKRALLSAPYEDLVPPPGWAWILNLVPFNSVANLGLTYLFQMALALSLLGLFTRISTLAATFLGLYVMAIPEFFGKIDHYHHLWIFMMILSLSPCGEALSVDQWIKKRSWSSLRLSARFTWPLRWAALTVGLIYFFPGIWKFIISGMDWALSDNMKYKLLAKWYETGFTPPLRIDQMPFLYKMGGLFTIAFESLFIFALFFPWARWWAIGSGFLFHHLTRILMGIWFRTLVYSYVLFVDWHEVYRWIKSKCGSQAPPTSSELWKPGKLDWIPGLYLLAMSFCGFTLVDSWPLTVYPTFASLEKPYAAEFLLSIQTQKGETIEILPQRDPRSLHRFGAPATLRSYLFRLAGEKNEEKQKSKLISLLSTLKDHPKLTGKKIVEVSLFRGQVALELEHRDDWPRHLKLIRAFPLHQ